MKLKYIKAFAACIITLAATACSDSDDWTPGPDPNPDSMGVYFSPMKNYSLTVGPDDSRQVPVTLGRVKYDEAASVSLNVVEVPEGVVVPSSVDFEAGEQTKIFYIDVEDMPAKTTGNVIIKLPEDVTSPYSDGTSFLNLKITVSGMWIPYGEKVTVGFYDLSWKERYPPETTELYNLDGTHQLKIPNFLNSGLDVVFEVGQYDSSANKYQLKVTKNFIDVKEIYGSDYAYTGWFLYDQANEILPEFSPDGTEPYITSVEFDDTFPDYQYLELYDEDSCICLCPYVGWADDSANYYTILIQFTPKFDLFNNTTTE